MPIPGFIYYPDSVIRNALQALYVGSRLKCSLEQRHDVISTTFQRCSNVRCPLGGPCLYLCFFYNTLSTC